MKDWFNSTNTCWDEAKLRGLVIESDIPLILSTRLCSHASTDLLGWHYNKSGIYSVKSAYWLGTHLHTNDQVEPPPGNVSLKRAIWKLKTAPKLHHFLWRIVSRSLPTMEVLKWRHISNESVCKRCCQSDETTNHLLFECPYAQQVWRASGVSNTAFLDHPTLTVEEKLTIIFECPSSPASTKSQQIALWLLWRLWKSRNILLFQKGQFHWRNLARYGYGDANECLSSQVFTQDNQNWAGTTLGFLRATYTFWSRPPKGWIKCNYDGSFNTDGIISSAGWTIRDDQSVYIGSGQAVDNKPTCFRRRIPGFDNCYAELLVSRVQESHFRRRL